jgi:hypothetical protein
MSLLLVNATIYPAAGAAPVEALAVQAGVVVAAGTRAECEAALRAPRVEDLGGQVVLPGLIDAHMHMELYTLSLLAIDAETSSLAECLGRVQARAAETPRGAWITGIGWNQNKWGGRFPTAGDLDAVTGDHPVWLVAKSAHAGWANTRALQAAGITAGTPDPEGGQIVRDTHGQPTGVLLETAMALVQAQVPAPAVEQLTDAYVAAQRQLWRLGLTGVHDFDGRRSLAAWQRLRERGQLGLRVLTTVRVVYLEHALALGLRSGLGDDWIRIGNVKVFLDGALGPRTAHMLAPYEGEPDNVGLAVTDEETFLHQARRAAAGGLAMTVHAIGDRANRILINGYARLRAEFGPDLRHRCEHVQIIDRADMPRLVALDLIASMQPLHATSDMVMADRLWGGRCERAYAWHSLHRLRARLAFGSDAPIETPNPWMGIHAAVTRRRPDGSPGPAGWQPDERLSVAEALRGYSEGAAYAGYAEDRLGRLTPGYHADLIVIDRDPYAVDPMALRDTTVSRTMVAGLWRE